MWYAGILTLAVLSFSAIAFAMLDVVPKVIFAARAQRFRCRLVATQIESSSLNPVCDRGLFQVELLDPEHLAGRRITATYRPNPGAAQEYGMRGSVEAGLFVIGSEYDCWLDPKNPDRAAMMRRPSYLLGSITGLLGIAGIASVLLLLFNVVSVELS